MYHNSGRSHIFIGLSRANHVYSGDLSERVGYDFEQIRSIAKVQVSYSFELRYLPLTSSR